MIVEYPEGHNGERERGAEDLLAEYLGSRVQRDQEAVDALIQALAVPEAYRGFFHRAVEPDASGGLFDACRAALTDNEIRELHAATVANPIVRDALATVRRVHLLNEVERLPRELRLLLDEYNPRG